jgi:arginyl-tRNA synthetase
VQLQFLFELPARLQKCLEAESYSQAVRYYVKARKVLHQYQHMPSFNGIQQDCQSSAKHLTECVDLLLQLNEPAEELCQEFLSHARQKIDADLARLEVQIRLLGTSNSSAGSSSGSSAGRPVDSSSNTADTHQDTVACLVTTPMDVLEFIDCGCNGFLSNICLVIASYNDMFLNRQQDE